MVNKKNYLNWKFFSWFLLFLVVGFKAYVIFWQFNFYNLLVPPSPDLIAQIEMTEVYLKAIQFTNGYPPLLHIIVAKLSLLFNVSVLDFYKIIGPYWLLVVIPPFYLLAKKMFGWKTAFWATAIFTLVSSNPLLNFADAQYADILGYNIIAPFYFLLLIDAVKENNYKKWILLIPVFILLLSAHHLTSILIYFLTIASLVVFLAISYFGGDKKEQRNSLIALIVFLLFGIIFFLIARILFGAILISALDSVVQFKPLINGAISAKLEYPEITTLLVPFLEFVGFAGIMLNLKYIADDKKNRFTHILLVVWVISFWLMSRSSVFVLPQRIFREISLPLAIASGFFIAQIIDIMISGWQKILASAIIGYLIVINTNQLFSSPFLLPNGFKYQSWYHAVDEEKYSYIKTNINKKYTILTNQSNPILQYKLEHDGYNITNLTISNQYRKCSLMEGCDKKSIISSLIKESGAKYLLIGTMPPNVNSETYSNQFGQYNVITEALSNYEFSDKQIVKIFGDKTKIVLLD